MFPLRLDLSLAIAKLKNISNLKVVPSDDECIMVQTEMLFPSVSAMKTQKAVKYLSY